MIMDFGLLEETENMSSRSTAKRLESMNRAGELIHMLGSSSQGSLVNIVDQQAKMVMVDQQMQTSDKTSQSGKTEGSKPKITHAAELASGQLLKIADGESMAEGSPVTGPIKVYAPKTTEPTKLYQATAKNIVDITIPLKDKHIEMNKQYENHCAHLFKDQPSGPRMLPRAITNGFISKHKIMKKNRN